MINCNRGGIFTFYLILLASYSSSSARPFELSERTLEKTLAPIYTSDLRTHSMASSNTFPSMAASGEAAAKPASSIVVPTEGLVIPASTVIESTDDDLNLAALEPLEEEL